jgi:phage repressor protein C with HTH and peptisase S24 domain
MSPAAKFIADHANPLGSRLKTEMKKRSLNSAALAKLADVKTSFLYDVISGKSANPSTIKLARVAEALGIPLDTLVGGDASAQAPSPARAKEDYVTVPRISAEASAGGGTLVSKEFEQERYCFRRSWIKEQLNTSPANLRLLFVRGDSMEPTLCHNDIVLVDTSKKIPTPPGIFVLFDGLGLVAKRIEYVGDPDTMKIRIASDNPQYATYERSIEDTFIIGRIVWFAREM